MNNLTLRIITALIGVTIIVGSIFVDEHAFVIVFMLIGLLTHIEYSRTINKLSDKQPLLAVYLPVAIGFIFMLSNLFSESDQFFYLIPLAAFISLPVLLISELYYNRNQPFQQVGLSVLGILYIPITFTIYVMFSIPFRDNQWFALSVLFMVWCNDTFAYFAGRWLGKHKLFERISPKKTWEGFFGGMLMAIVCGICFHKFYPETSSMLEGDTISMNLLQWIGLGIVVSISGTFGDLVESMLKRSIDIKDSGSLLPGHGGFLDRFDGFLFAVPAGVAYVFLINII